MSPLLLLAPAVALGAWLFSNKPKEIALSNGTVVKVGGYKLLYSGPVEDTNMSEKVMSLPASTLAAIESAANKGLVDRFNNEGFKYLCFFDNADEQRFWLFQAKVDAPVVFENA